MTTENQNHRDTETSRGTQKKSGIVGFIKDIGREAGTDLVSETGTTIKWAMGGVLIGAVVLGGLGFWKFGVTGLTIGAIAGGVVGGVAGGWFYFSA